MTIRYRPGFPGLTPVLRRNICELDMVQFGTESCAPGHSFGPAVRDHWLIHYIHEGSGHFSADGREYALGKGDGFYLICPNQVTWYGADWDHPWRYTWIGFSGTRAAEALRKAGLDEQHPLFHMAPSAFDGLHRLMDSATDRTAERDFRLTGALYLFFAELIAHNGLHDASPPGEARRIDYVRKATDFFRMYYARPIGIAAAAAHVGLDRSYLSQIFKKETGVNPRDFLIGLRLEKACQFMGNPKLSIADIARSVGYEDPLRFSKLFHKHRGLSPRAYRQALLAATPAPVQASGLENPNL